MKTKTWCGTPIELLSWGLSWRWLSGWLRLLLRPWAWRAARRCWRNVGHWRKHALAVTAASGRALLIPAPPRAEALWSCEICRTEGKFSAAPWILVKPSEVMLGHCDAHAAPWCLDPC